MRAKAFLIFSLFFASPAIAGEQEDMLKCIVAAERHASISLSRSNYEYDGGWFSSDISWHMGYIRALCQVSSEVDKLVINGITFIVEGITGNQAKDLFSQKVTELVSLKAALPNLASKYEKTLLNMEAKLKKPKPDIDKIKMEFEASVKDIKLRILGTTNQLEETYGGDEVSKGLRDEVNVLTQKYENLNAGAVARDEYDKVYSELLEIKEHTKVTINTLKELHGKLNATISTQRRELFSAEQKVKNLENKYKSEAEVLQGKLKSLETQLALFQQPVEPLIDEIISLIRTEDFSAVFGKLKKLQSLPRYDPKTLELFVNEVTKVVRPIPSTEFERNLAAYKALLKLAPDNSSYTDKVNSYEQKIINAKQKKETDDIVTLIRLSSDLNKYRSKMAKAALDLIRNGKCTRGQIKDYGGWVKSGGRPGQYFMDCDDQRVWFNPKSKNTTYADSAISETSAATKCRNSITAETINKPNFHFFDKSYTVHSPGKAVTYLQGFDVLNGVGAKIKYRAYCLIQPSGALELSLQRK